MPNSYSVLWADHDGNHMRASTNITANSLAEAEAIANRRVESGDMKSVVEVVRDEPETETDNNARDEAGHVLDVFVEQQMSNVGRSAYWQAISEGATPDQAYSHAEAVEYQESLARRANVNNVPDDTAHLADEDDDTKVATSHV